MLGQDGATWQVEGVHASDGSIAAIERAIFTRDDERLTYFFDGDFVTRFEAENPVSSESAAFEIDYHSDRIVVRGYVPAGAPTPVQTVTLTEDDVPGLSDVFDEIREAGDRSSPAQRPIPISFLAGEPSEILVEAEVIDHQGLPVSDVNVRWSMVVPPEMFGCGGTVETDPEARKLTELVCRHPSMASHAQRSGPMEFVSEGLFRQRIPLISPLQPGELERLCIEAVDGWGGKSTAMTLLIGGVVTFVDFQTGGATFGLRTIGVFGLSSAVPGIGAYVMAPSAADCLTQRDTREAALQVPWSVSALVTEGRQFPKPGQAACSNANHPDFYSESERREFVLGESEGLRTLEPVTIQLPQLLRVTAVAAGGPHPPEVGRETVYAASAEGGTGSYAYFWDDGDWSGDTWQYAPMEAGPGQLDLMVTSGPGTSCYFEAFQVREQADDDAVQALESLALRVVQEHYGGGRSEIEVRRGLEAGVFLPPGASGANEGVDVVVGWDPSAGGEQGFGLTLFEASESAVQAISQVELPQSFDVGRCSQSAATIGGASGVIVTCEPTTVGYGFTPYTKTVMVKGAVLIDVESYVKNGDDVVRALLEGLP